MQFYFSLSAFQYHFHRMSFFSIHISRYIICCVKIKSNINCYVNGYIMQFYFPLFPLVLRS